MGRFTGPEFSHARRCRRLALAAGLIAAAVACSEVASTGADSADAAPEGVGSATTTRVVVAGEAFEVEVAADPLSRYRGLSGRGEIPHNGGMLFVLTRPQPMSMVMRDCSNAIDVAFIDAMGRVVAIHEMPPELPRRSGESSFQYEQRLPEYPSGAPVSFALETAGGRLAELGLRVGDRLHFPAQALISRAQSELSTPD
jgi:uncharacterized membrane protein (UPF0127 family)